MIPINEPYSDGEYDAWGGWVALVSSAAPCVTRCHGWEGPQGGWLKSGEGSSLVGAEVDTSLPCRAGPRLPPHVLG